MKLTLREIEAMRQGGELSEFEFLDLLRRYILAREKSNRLARISKQLQETSRGEFDRARIEVLND